MFKWFKPKPRPTQVLTLPEPKPVEDITPVIDLNHADPILGVYVLRTNDPYHVPVPIQVVEELNGYVKYHYRHKQPDGTVKLGEDHWSMKTETLKYNYLKLS